jgi:ribosomal protein L11 methyltransferase
VLFELSIEAPDELCDLLSAELFAAGAAGVEERESTLGSVLVVYCASESELSAVKGQIEARVEELHAEYASAEEIRIEVLRRADGTWQNEWMRHLKPEVLTKSFVIQPASDTTPAPPAMTCIVYEPALAFGTGSHATTRLAARSVERHCKLRPGCSVLDVGTGNGVLAFVAALSGASDVVGVDNDPIALASARENATLNGLSTRCRFHDAELPASAVYDLVVANIDLGTLIELAPRLLRRLAPRGTLVITGVLAEQAPELLAAYVPHGAVQQRAEHAAEWCLLELSLG